MGFAVAAAPLWPVPLYRRRQIVKKDASPARASDWRLQLVNDIVIFDIRGQQGVQGMESSIRHCNFAGYSILNGALFKGIVS
jgi:hypothetical protein